MGEWQPGKGIDAHCRIGKKLFRVLITHGTQSLTENQLGFEHGATVALATNSNKIRLTDTRFRFKPADWTTISQAEIDEIIPGTGTPGIPRIPDLIDCVIISGNDTASHPCPDIQAMADAFANAPANATW